LTVALQSADGERTYAEQRFLFSGLDPFSPAGNIWQRHDFALKSSGTDTNARFVLTIDGPGKVWVDQVFLSPTGEDLFKELPFRADIARGLQEQGLTLLRYGGSMVNAPEYRWKKMIGDRDRRPQYKGWWYPYSTNGFGIEEFIRFCRAAGFEPVVAINVEETPQDVADLIDYLNGPITTEWGRRRAENGHPDPYHLRFLQIGNEETTNAHYIERFKILHDAIRPRDPRIELIIAAWWEPDNPISKRIVQELNGKATLWDVHIGGDDPREGAKVDATFVRMRKLVEEWAPGTPLKACVLEENGGRHDLARALGHAGILNATQRHGDFVLIDCPANCLQPWKQNDNGWDQGQLFFTSGQVWGMPPYYAQQMAAAVHQPLRIHSEVESPGRDLDLTATRDEAGSSVVLKVVNAGDAPHRAAITIDGFGPVDPRAEAASLSGNLTDRNLPEAPDRVRPSRWIFEGAAEKFFYEFPARSYTILRLKRAAP
jgi:alpha-L-arabinofuranosidase